MLPDSLTAPAEEFRRLLNQLQAAGHFIRRGRLDQGSEACAAIDAEQLAGNPGRVIR